ncbi:hypothetical protein [Frateuria terrea]|uniref:Phage major capsid protein, HK97 family n=1 Tax=Frateuria terrea TaxID=529704 RepID=A0A1H6ZUQ3_9GAMM|nr:hypothetical protein [Frateuria terrea]SEJ55914.1 hypothetical protein SAMN04487997_0216 [Frateuria terrea]SFP46874.1 hypothetical protein SAMN02927913_2173 [Frateuria terrea]
MSNDITTETLGMLKGVYQSGPLAKAGNTVTTAAGLVNYDLQAPAKNLYPIITILSKKIPRVKGKGGTATNWKQVNNLFGSGFDAMGWVPEGQRSGVMTLDVTDKAASYRTLGEEAALTFEAQSASEGFEDERSRSSIRLLQKAMRKEELAILGGNASVALGTCATPTLSASGSGATLPALTYSVICVELTFEGLKNSSVSATGVATTKTITGQDGQTFSLAGGSGNKSTAATQAVTLGQTLTATVVPSRSALGFAWYVGASGSETLQAITTVPTAAFSAPLASGNQAATAITADNSRNQNLGFDGLLVNALNPANNAYVKQLNGATLTASGRGSVTEIDVMLKSMWDNYKLSSTVIYVSAQEQQGITNKVLSGTSGSLLRQNIAMGEPGAIVAGNVVAHYYNPFALNGGVMIPVLLHPDVPAGCIIAWADNLPAQYQSNEVPNVAEMHLRRDWYEIEWPLVTRSYQHGIYAEETLAVYAPFAMGVITGVGAG